MHILAGLGVLLAGALRLFFVAFGAYLVKLVLSAFVKRLFAGGVSLVAIYTTMYNVDAAAAFLEWLKDNTPELMDNVTFQGIGTLIQATRIDDCLAVIAGAYGSGWMARLVFKAMPGTSADYS